MPLAPGLQSSRFELKYVITESCARAVRDFALSYLAPDPHADPSKGCEYPVNSLYLDSPGLALCKSTMHGHKNRFKLRIRYYDDAPDGLAFLEIKRRLNDVILKQRCSVRKTSVARILNGHFPGRDDIVDTSPRGHAALTEFCSLCARINALGQVFVCYVREAYVSPASNSVRLTFDRRVYGTRYNGSGLLTAVGDRAYPEVPGVILEIKFTDRFPVWMRHMCRALNLVRQSMAKYVECATALRIEELQLA
jgi:hypothetical protein